MRCVRDSNPWPHAWQACILTNWTNAPKCFLAVRTGLEPATPCVTGMYSNQLNYRTITFSSAVPLNCDAKVGGLFELCKSCTHIFFIIFQSSLIINLLHRNFFIHILKDTSVFVLLLFHSSVCYALQAPLLSKKYRNRRIHFCQKGTDSKQIHSR